MKFISLSKLLFSFCLFFIVFFKLSAEDTVDIWKKQKIENKNINADVKKSISKIKKSNIQLNPQNKIIQIEESQKEPEETKKLYGLFDPGENNFSLNMWDATDGKVIKDTFKRIQKIKLSNSAEEIFINLIMTYSYPPSLGISEEEMLKLKIDWLIENKKYSLLEDFLNKNKNFPEKSKVIKYLVDQNLAGANIKTACQKTEFIDKEIKDKYLEKFKIYCLIFNNKKNQARLLLDLLREEKLSDNFYDDRINFLLGYSDKIKTKVYDNNLLNFYLSSITIPDFKYEPGPKTGKFIWEYLNSANLLIVEDVEDKNRIKSFELAANINTYDKLKIFAIYKKFPFNLNQLLNAEEMHRSLDEIEARALIYQKFLLSDKNDNKLRLLFLLKDLFKKDNLSNIFTQHLSDILENLAEDDIPASYQKLVLNNILKEEDYKLGKIKYDDKVLHRSKIIKFYTEEGTSIKKSQKDFESVYRKIKRNKNYFISAKDIALIESLEADGLSIPKSIDYLSLAKKYSIPANLANLVENQEIGLFVLKVVEIIGQDETLNLDPETIYFLTSLTNKAGLKKLRNKILTSSLPLRV